MAQTAWLNASNGTWSTAANWSGGLPSAGVDAAITVTGAAYTNSQSGGTIAARTLLMDSADATLHLTANALLNLSLTLPSTFVHGAAMLNGSRIRGNFTVGSAFTVRQTAGSSSLSFNRNEGVIRGTAGTLSIGGVNTGWTNGPGATIEADGNSAIVGFTSGGGSTWASFGEMIARNGAQLNLGGLATTAGLGTLKLFDTARINLDGTIINTGAILSGPQGGSFDATGGTIIGGTIASNAIVLRSRIGSGVVGLVLDGAVWEGDVTVTNNSVRFYPRGTFTGTQFNAGGAFGVTYARTTTISNKIFTLTSSGSQTTFTVGTDLGAAQTVTLAADTVLRGTGFIIAGEADNSTLVNQGLIHHLAGNSTFGLGTLDNQGRIQADAGICSIAPGTLINDGIIEARAGSLVPLAVSTFTQGAAGELRGAGKFNLNTPISGGTLRPGDDGLGTLTVQAPFSSPATFTGPTTFAVEIGGGTNDQIFFNHGSKGVELGDGVVTLALTLLAPPTASSYRVVHLPNGSQNLLTGTFVGLAEGSTLSAVHGNSNYTFTVDYDTKGLTLRDPVATPLSGTEDPPTLTISTSGTNTVVISWPTPSTGFNLQVNTNLATTNWVTPAETVSDDGTNKSIIVNPPTGNRFYRLFKP